MRAWFTGRHTPPIESRLVALKPVISCMHRPMMNSDQPTRCQPVVSAHCVGHVPGPRRGTLPLAIFQSGKPSLLWGKL